MQKFFAMTLAIVLSGMVVEAHAEEEVDCKAFSEMAGNVMEGRQVGVPMSKMMGVLGDTELGEELVISAYEVPKFSTPEYIQDTEQEFEDAWYMRCIKSIR